MDRIYCILFLIFFYSQERFSPLCLIEEEKYYKHNFEIVPTKNLFRFLYKKKLFVLKNLCKLSSTEGKDDYDLSVIRLLRLLILSFSLICTLKGHGHDFDQILFLRLYYIQCSRNAFLIIK